MNLRRLFPALTPAFFLLAGAGHANADILDVYGKVKGGYIAGKGVTDLKSNIPGMPSPASDFFEIEKGPAMGLELGVELLFIDVSLNAYQFFGQGAEGKIAPGETAGTLFELLAGLDVEVQLDDAATPKLVLRLGGNAGVAFGLHGKLNPPLKEEEVANWGLVLHGIGALEWYITNWFFIGAEAQAGYHYFIPGGDAVVNEFSQGMQFMGFITTGFRIQPFSGDKDKSRRDYKPYRTPSTAPKVPPSPRPRG